MSSKAGTPRYKIQVDATANGRVRGKVAITVFGGDGAVSLTDHGDLRSVAGRKKVAKGLAERLGDIEPGDLLPQLEAAWNDLQEQHRRMREQAAAGDPSAAPEAASEILDEVPAAVRRPLCLLGGRAYAATWAYVRQTVTRAVDPESGAVTNHDPPLVTTRRALVVVRDDGAAFSDEAVGLPGVRPLDELGVEVELPHLPPPGRCWSGAGLKRFLANDRPAPADVFGRCKAVVNRFVDFDRSLAPQETMCEVVACYVLATYLLDAFHVVGYLWPNGDPGCGKTTLLQVVAEVAYLGQLVLAGGSYATLRDLADYGASLAFDDAENVMDPKRTDPDKRTLLLAGNRKGATVTVKEKSPGDAWETRHVNTFCPRQFSATRLPDEVLGSRSIVVPLVRSDDPVRSRANPADHASWPCDRRRLADDLWALGMTHLPELPGHDARAAAAAELSGRDLEPWRAVFAVALWLDERHGVAGLHRRMTGLAAAYQEERGGFEADPQTRVLFQALLGLLAGRPGCDEITFSPAELAGRMNHLAREEGLCEKDKEFTTPRKVGWALKKKRFRKGGRDRRAKLWHASAEEVTRLARAYGVTPDGQADAPAGGPEGPEDVETF
jgi:hypothetical protein